MVQNRQWKSAHEIAREKFNALGEDEINVLLELAHTDREIRSRLNLTRNELRSILRRLYRKLKVTNRIKAVVLAQEKGVPISLA